MSMGMLMSLRKARTKEALEKLYTAWRDSLEAKEERLREELSSVRADLEALEAAYRQLKKERGWE